MVRSGKISFMTVMALTIEEAIEIGKNMSSGWVVAKADEISDVEIV
jgi:hypothetical protein